MPNEMTPTELLPCPFCGGAGSLDMTYPDTDYVGCVPCDYWIRSEYWNRRESSSGWVSVPVEPTEKMVMAGWKIAWTGVPTEAGKQRIATLYKATIAAAPPDRGSRD